MKLLKEMVFDYEWGRLNTKRAIIPDEGDRFVLFSSIRLYTLAQMTRILRTAGPHAPEDLRRLWREKRYDMEGFRMIVIAGKEQIPGVQQG